MNEVYLGVILQCCNKTNWMIILSKALMFNKLLIKVIAIECTA